MVNEKNLVKSYTYLVKKIIRKNFSNFDVNINDLEAIGFLELVSCAEKFNRKKDGSFISFAHKQIYTALKEYIDNSINLESSEINISLPGNLTEKQTKELFTQIEYNGIRDEIINGNLWIVSRVINCCFKYEKDKDDLMGVGASALVDFVDKFLPHKNNCFYKGCSKYIYNSIKKYLMHERVHISLDEIINDKKEEDFNLIDSNFRDFVESIENREIIENVLSYLTDKEKAILFMSYNGLTNKEIAEKFNVCKSYIQKLTNKIEKKIGIVYKGFKGAKYEPFEERIKKYK